MNWLVFFFALELGIVPQAGVLMYEPYEAFEMKGALYTELEAEVLMFNVLFVNGGVRTYVTPNNNDFNFSPNSTVYDFGAGLRFKDTIELGWRHCSFYPIFPYLPVYEHQMKGMEGAYDEIYLRIEGKTRKG